MTISEAQRSAFVMDLISRNWSPEGAAAVAWALMPFDDFPVPQRSLEKKIRKRCQELALELRGVLDNEVRSLAAALSATREYLQIARKKNEVYFINYWTTLETQLLAAQGKV